MGRTQPPNRTFRVTRPRRQAVLELVLGDLGGQAGLEKAGKGHELAKSGQVRSGQPIQARDNIEVGQGHNQDAPLWVEMDEEGGKRLEWFEWMDMDKEEVHVVVVVVGGACGGGGGGGWVHVSG